MTIDLEALKQVALVATPGPWEATPSGNVLSDVPAMDEFGPTAGRRFALRCSPSWHPDAKFIAAVNPAVILELIARLEHLERKGHA
jgi:hypothetical protein